MKKLIISATTLVLGLGFAGCSSNGNPSSPTPLSTVIPTSAPNSYVQIERLSRPAIKEVFESFNDHKLSNASEPYADTTIANDIVATEDLVRPPSSSAGTDFGKTLQSVLYPDEYLVNLNGTAPVASANDPELFLSAEVDGSGAFGGRAPNDDVIGLELPVLFGHILPKLGLTAEDNEENDCLSAQNVTPTVLTTSSFPYLASPH